MRNSATLEGRPLLDVASYARRGPGRRERFSSAEIALIQRTVNRTPEVMVKVLSSGATSLKAVRVHIAYLDRGGELEIETDEGGRLKDKEAGRRLVEGWDLDLEEHRRQSDLRAQKTRRPPRLIHKILFSMPPGTRPEKLLQAVKAFAREEFALRHRYAMVLHTDEPHPHVHLIVKAVSEQGYRLNIRKATLRAWRMAFADHLRRVGVAANATDRAVRGATRPTLSDGLFRSAERAESPRLRERMQYARNSSTSEKARERLLATRESVRGGWSALRSLLEDRGYPDLGARVARFVDQMPPPETDLALPMHRIPRYRSLIREDMELTH